MEILFYHGLTPEILEGKFVDIDGMPYLEIPEHYVRRTFVGGKVGWRVEYSRFPLSDTSKEVPSMRLSPYKQYDNK